MIEADVLIAGAGAGGAACAIAAASRGCRVLIADAGEAKHRLGETLPGAARKLLAELGVLEAFEADRHPPSLGLASRWGSASVEVRDALADPHGAAWRLDRAGLARRLLERALQCGCRLVTPARVASAAAETGRWRVRLAGAADREVRCGYLVDATGRSSVLARMLGARRVRTDNLVCDMLVSPGGAPAALDGFSLVEALPYGWRYATRLPGGERLTSVHSDFDLLARPRDGSTRVAAWSARLVRFAGPGWAAVGDAAYAFDPLSSQGLFNALYSGLRLGEKLAAAPAQAPAAHAAEMEAVWSAYRRHQRLYYAAEPRWRALPFWRRRSGAQSAARGASAAVSSVHAATPSAR